MVHFLFHNQSYHVKNKFGFIETKSLNIVTSWIINANKELIRDAICVNIVGTPPPDNTWHAFLSGSASSGFPPKETRGALLLFGLPQGEAHDTRKHHIRTIVISHPDDRHIPSGYVYPNC